MGIRDNPETVKERLRFIYVDIEGEEFIFDKIGLKLFNEEFNNKSFEVFIDGEGYLARQNLYHPDWPPQYFHRWLKFKRTSTKDIDKKDIHVHHKNGDVHDNRLRNLIFFDPYRHYQLHRKKKAYKTFCEKFYENEPDADPRLCSWAWAKFKEEHEIDDD